MLKENLNFLEEIDNNLEIERIAYSILGIKEGANKKEIKSAYRKKSLKYHPDHFKDKNDQNESDNYFILINCAYRLLYFGEECDLLRDRTLREEDDLLPKNKWAYFLWWKNKFY